jgi:tetratricopeptide (TPR) repeat protein
MTPDRAIQIANQYQRSGRPAEAWAVCRQLLAQQPDHADALHLLGILSAQASELDTAVSLIGRAIQVRPVFPQAWSNLGCVLVNQGRFEEAIAAYSRVVQLCPTDAAAHYGLGRVLREHGRLDEAITAFAQAAQLKPNDAEAHLQLGITLRSKGRLDEAIAAYRRAIALKFDCADTYNNLGNALRDNGQVDQAIAQYAKALELKPADPVFYLNLANALRENEQLTEAVAAYERVLRLDPACAEAYSQMGAALASLHRFGEALEAHRRALTLRPDDAKAHEALGATLLAKREMAEAIASFRRALELSPDLAAAWNGVGAASLALGRLDDAVAAFSRALALSQNEVMFHKNLISVMGRKSADPAQIERLTMLLDQPSLPVQERIGAGFALGKMLDDADRFDEAFAFYAQANARFKQWRAQAGDHFEAVALRHEVDRQIESFTPQFFAQRHGWGVASELPVFIVGMPRSGTTLVEQILASHPAIFGAGEMPDISLLAGALANGNPTAPMQRWNPAAIDQAANAYLEHLRALGGTAVRVTDKMLGNVFQLGLIAVLFPSARVIFCRRDAHDTCLSCYFQWFPSPSLLYTYDLADCGRQFLETERLMAHWLKVLPLPILEVQYEELVADQEGQSRRLIDFLGLPWDPACLQFHQTQRAVMTASVWQVRQPMYTRSVGRWRHYQRHLAPLFEILGTKKAEDAQQQRTTVSSGGVSTN